MKTIILVALLALAACNAAQVTQADAVINTGCVLAPLAVPSAASEAVVDCAAIEALEPAVGDAILSVQAPK